LICMHVYMDLLYLSWFFFLNCGNGCFLKYFLFENILK
jgi:hypothetical protein